MLPLQVPGPVTLQRSTLLDCCGHGHVHVSRIPPCHVLLAKLYQVIDRNMRFECDMRIENLNSISITYPHKLKRKLQNEPPGQHRV